MEGLKGITKLVVLNSCLSENQATLIAEHIEYVVGSTIKIEDKLAKSFSLGLYNGLGEGNSIEKSVRRGIANAMILNDSAEAYFKFWKRGDLIEF